MVTGSQGYIGTNLCKLLIQKGCNIVQIDSKIYTDIFRTDLTQYKPDVIIHLAAVASIPLCEQDKQKAIRDNVLASQIISEFASMKGNIPVVFASSQAIYDTSTVYGMTKFIGEETFKTFNKHAILRFANVYGGDNYINNLENESVIAKWIRQYKNDETLVIHGSGAQTRDFIHVDDLCQIIYRCASRWLGNTTFDVGTGEEISIAQLASMFPDAKIEFDRNHFAGVENSVADIKTMRVFGEPTIRVGDYLKEVL